MKLICVDYCHECRRPKDLEFHGSCLEYKLCEKWMEKHANNSSSQQCLSCQRLLTMSDVSKLWREFKKFKNVEWLVHQYLDISKNITNPEQISEWQVNIPKFGKHQRFDISLNECRNYLKNKNTII